MKRLIFAQFLCTLIQKEKSRKEKAKAKTNEKMWCHVQFTAN